jgi:hypothetical protein
VTGEVLEVVAVVAGDEGEAKAEAAVEGGAEGLPNSALLEACASAGGVVREAKREVRVLGLGGDEACTTAAEAEAEVEEAEAAEEEVAVAAPVPSFPSPSSGTAAVEYTGGTHLTALCCCVAAASSCLARRNEKKPGRGGRSGSLCAWFSLLKLAPTGPAPAPPLPAFDAADEAVGADGLALREEVVAAAAAATASVELISRSF